MSALLTPILALLLLFPGPEAALGPQAATATASVKIERFNEIAHGLYRGAQPQDADFTDLRTMGIKTVINFQKENSEKAVVEQLGMKSVHIPLNAWDRVPDTAIRTFFEILREPENYPVFIHCQRGTDRTGIMAGFYRMAFEGWDGPRAYHEARQIGMRWWYRGLKSQLQAFNPLVFPDAP